MSLVVLPRLDFSFLAKEVWGGTTIGAVAGVWSVVIALATATLTVVVLNFRRFPALRESLDAGAISSVLPILTISSLVGFGAVIAALPAFADVRDALLSIGGGPLVSLTVAMNVLAGLTGTASGGMAIVLSSLGDTYMRHGRRARHRSRADASRDHDWRWHTRCTATQWCGGDLARHLRMQPPRELSGHRHGGDRRRHPRIGDGHPARYCLWFLLSADLGIHRPRRR